MTVQNLGLNRNGRKILGDSLAQKSGVHIKKKDNGSFTIKGALRKFNSVRNFEGFKNQLIQDIVGQLDNKAVIQERLKACCREIKDAFVGTESEKNNHQIRFLLEVFTMKLDNKLTGEALNREITMIKTQLLSEESPFQWCLNNDDKIGSLVDIVNEGNIDQIREEVLDYGISGLGINYGGVHRGLIIQHGEGLTETHLDFCGGSGAFFVNKVRYEETPLMLGGSLTEEEMKDIIEEYFKIAYKTSTRNSATLLPMLGDAMNCHKVLYKAMCKVPRLSKLCWDLPFVVSFRGALKK